jgi:Ca2+/H+ antiporter
MFSLYALWQLAGDLSIGEAGGAVRRGLAIARFEQRLGLPAEASAQQLFLGDRGLVRSFDLYYVVLHVMVTGLCLVWLFARHRDRYPQVRNTLALATAACLVVALIPVAPPRLVPGLGVTDTGRLVGPTVYPATARPGLDQLSAMPSVHVAWAVVVAGAVVYALSTPWRWLALAYPVFTTTVVVATGNHYWLDGAVALAVVAAAGLVSLRITPPADRRTPGSSGRTPSARSAPVSPPGSGPSSRVPA